MIAELNLKAIFVVLHFIFVHGPDNQKTLLNIDEISSIREPRSGAEEHYGKQVKCIIFMTNSKFFGTVETCEEVVKKIKEIEDKGDDLREDRRRESPFIEPIFPPAGDYNR